MHDQEGIKNLIKRLKRKDYIWLEEADIDYLVSLLEDQLPKPVDNWHDWGEVDPADVD